MKTALRRRIFLATSSIAALTLASAAGAQTTAPAEAGQASTAVVAGAAQAAQESGAQRQSGGNVGEVVVTAQKREQSLQQVPVAISAFTSTERDKIGIDSVQDMTNFTPGLEYNTGDDRVSLRGIGRYTNQLSADSSVGVYEDGAFETFTVKVGNDSLFVDRIEVLRGPQGTLYGRNSIAGAINIISRQPTDYWYGEYRQQIDSYGYLVEEGAVSGPLTDHVQFRLSGSKTDQDNGYFNNLNGLQDEGNRRNEWYVEGQLRGDLGSQFDWWVKAFAGNWEDQGGNAGGRISNSVIVGPDGHTRLPEAAATFGCNGFTEYSDALVPSLGAQSCPGNSNVVTVNPTNTDPANGNIRNYYSIYPQSQDVDDYWGVTARATGHFSGFDIKYVGEVQRYTYREHEEWGEGQQLASGVISYQNPYGVTIYPDSQLLYKEYHWFTTNEINFISTGNAPLQWVVGAYNFNEGYKQPEEINLPGQAQLVQPISGCGIIAACTSVTGAALPAANPNRDVYNTLAHMGAETFAGFGQLDWKITSAWKATLGIRYGYDSKWGDDAYQYYEFLPIYDVNVPYAVTGINTSQAAQQHGAASASHYDATTGLWVRKLSGDWSGTTGVAGLQWEPDRDTNVYVKYSRGFKSGGFNAGSGFSPNPETAPETLNDYQFGVKKNFGRTLQFNLDVFYDQYYDAQIPIGVVGTGGLVNSQFYNLPEARTDGVEIETIWAPTRALQFMLDYGFDDSYIIKSGCVVDTNDPTATKVGATPGGCTGGGQNLKGDELPNDPKNKVAINGLYTFDLPTGMLSFSASVIWRDVQYGSIFNRPQYAAPDWDQLDLRAEYKPNGGHWTLIAYGKNILNSTGYIAGAGAVAQTNGTFIKNYALTPPATGGVEIQYKF